LRKKKERKLAPTSVYFHYRGSHAGTSACGGLKKSLTSAVEYNINAIMNIQFRIILTTASLAFALAIWSPNEVSADELKEAKVTQVIQDVKVLPSNASPRPAAVNDNVRPGTAVQTGTQSRSELTFKDQTITRLGEKTIFSVGEGARTIDLGSGQFLLYVPKKSGGAKVKMGPVTAAITGTTVLGNVNPNGTTTFIVLEGGACIYLDSVGQSLFVGPGQQLTFDPIANRLEDPVDVDLSKVITSPLIKDFRRLPSAHLIEQEIQNQHRSQGWVSGNDALTRAVRVAGASSVETATPDQFLRALNSLFVRSNAREVCAYVGAAVRARPDLAPQIVVAALRVSRVGPRTDSKDFKQPVGKEISCEEADCIIRAAIAAHPSATREIVDAAIAAAPLLRDCIVAAAAQPCPLANAPVQTVILPPVNPSEFVPPVVSPEQPPSTGL
jgi:hypothetical protein